jgi:hypothetical protein
METFQAGRVVRVLTRILSALYFIAWGVTGLLLILVPAVEIFADHDALTGLNIGVPVTLEPRDVRMASTWNGETGTITLGRTAAKLEVPFSLAPASFRIATYVAFALGLGLTLLFLHHLRELFRSARAGAPFDPRNAARLRWMALLIAAGHALTEVFGGWQAATVLRTIAAPIPLLAPFPTDEKALFAFNESVILVALMLLALAEIFKRGAVLEDEQSLVV